MCQQAIRLSMHADRLTFNLLRMKTLLICQISSNPKANISYA